MRMHVLGTLGCPGNASWSAGRCCLSAKGHPCRHYLLSFPFISAAAGVLLLVVWCLQIATNVSALQAAYMGASM